MKYNNIVNSLLQRELSGDNQNIKNISQNLKEVEKIIEEAVKRLTDQYEIDIEYYGKYGNSHKQMIRRDKIEGVSINIKYNSEIEFNNDNVRSTPEEQRIINAAKKAIPELKTPIDYNNLSRDVDYPFITIDTQKTIPGKNNILEFVKKFYRLVDHFTKEGWIDKDLIYTKTAEYVVKKSIQDMTDFGFPDLPKNTISQQQMEIVRGLKNIVTDLEKTKTENNNKYGKRALSDQDNLPNAKSIKTSKVMPSTSKSIPSNNNFINIELEKLNQNEKVKTEKQVDPQSNLNLNILSETFEIHTKENETRVSTTNLDTLGQCDKNKREIESKKNTNTR